ncbi:hypothetical protein A2U01_0095632, partial [Trifolium medium]|nr:hypothetical protein [Trifolium medium]
RQQGKPSDSNSSTGDVACGGAKCDQEEAGEIENR